MTSPTERATPTTFDLRAWTTRFELEAREHVGDPIRIDFDLPDGPVRVSADPGALDHLFTNLVLNVRVVMEPGGRLTVHVAPDEMEVLPDEEEVVDASRFMHVSIEDRGYQPVDTLFRRLLDPLIVAAPQLSTNEGTLRWGGKILFDESDDETRVIHLLLPYAAERESAH